MQGVELAASADDGERLACGARAAGVLVEFDGRPSRPVAVDRLPHPASDAGAARALAVMELGRLGGLAGDRAHLQAVEAVAGAAARRQGDVGREPTDVAVGRAERRRRAHVVQAARRRRTSCSSSSSSIAHAAFSVNSIILFPSGGHP